MELIYYILKQANNNENTIEKIYNAYKRFYATTKNTSGMGNDEFKKISGK